MPFIGIVAKESDANFIKNLALKNSVNSKFEFININNESIQNLKNIKFETIVINENENKIVDNSKYLENVINNSKYLIINSDVVKNRINVNSKTKLITYGLNNKAAITMSSIKNDRILICIQKEFNNINNKIIDMQEVGIEIEKNNLKKVCNSMAVFSILTIYGEKMKKI